MSIFCEQYKIFFNNKSRISSIDAFFAMKKLQKSCEFARNYLVCGPAATQLFAKRTAYIVTDLAPNDTGSG